MKVNSIEGCEYEFLKLADDFLATQELFFIGRWRRTEGLFLLTLPYLIL